MLTTFYKYQEKQDRSHLVTHQANPGTASSDVLLEFEVLRTDEQKDGRTTCEKIVLTTGLACGRPWGSLNHFCLVSLGIYKK